MKVNILQSPGEMPELHVLCIAKNRYSASAAWLRCYLPSANISAKFGKNNVEGKMFFFLFFLFCTSIQQ